MNYLSRGIHRAAEKRILDRAFSHEVHLSVKKFFEGLGKIEVPSGVSGGAVRKPDDEVDVVCLLNFSRRCRPEQLQTLHAERFAHVTKVIQQRIGNSHSIRGLGPEMRILNTGQ